MKDSVSAVFVSKSRVYFIQRQNYLPVFPGYFAPPGGKVDSDDSSIPLSHSIWPKEIDPKILHALIREVKEELNYDLLIGIESGEVQRIDAIGTAVTPDFNPYRFNNYYIKITVKNEIYFCIDKNEASNGGWYVPNKLLSLYYKGEILVVPPVIKLIKALDQNISFSAPITMNIDYNADLYVPIFESIFGVVQLMPFSRTFPPANRTNAFIIGDKDKHKILVDPSPRDEAELIKFLNTVDTIGIDSIFLTHHHADHYQYSREIALKYKIGIELSAYTFNKIGQEYFSGIPITIRKDGDIITTSLGEDIIVHEIPGHDEGQLGLAPRNLNWFLVGDLVQTIGTVVIGAPEGDMIKYFESLEKVIALNPKHIIPSHGIILGGTHKILETLDHRKIREDQIIELLKKMKTENEIFQIIYKNIPSSLIPYAKKTLDAHFVKLRIEKRM
jgi:glyoxylase-like metal-dependent hydrolase (beta-lactamase superfamily II)/8-oxo-dGTP pyrophosphatase MutT (NUDIX family)